MHPRSQDDTTASKQVLHVRLPVFDKYRFLPPEIHSYSQGRSDCAAVTNNPELSVCNATEAELSLMQKLLWVSRFCEQVP